MVTGRNLRLMIALLLSTVAAAQVVVPVVVKDASGAAVHGLQASDFALGCKKATLLSVEEITPVTVDGFSDPNPLFVVYDAESLSEVNQKEMNALLLSFLRAEEEQHHAVTLLKNTHTDLQLINNFSSRPEVVLAALDRIAPGNKSADPSSEAVTDAAFAKQVDEEVQRLKQLTEIVSQSVRGGAGSVSMDERLGSLQSVARSLQRSSHRKTLLWLTGYLPVYIDNGEVKGASGGSTFDPHINANRMCQGESECGEAQFANGGLRVTTPAWAEMVKALNDSRISVYTAFINGNPGDITDCCIHLLRGGRTWGFGNLAESTGGEQVAAEKLAPFSALIAQLRQKAAPYYLLTLKAPMNDSWNSCPIKVNKDKVKVESADGFFAMK